MMRTLAVLLVLALAPVPGLRAETSGTMLDPRLGIALSVPGGWKTSSPPSGVLVQMAPKDRTLVYRVREVDGNGQTAAQIEERLARSAASRGQKVVRRWRHRESDPPASSMLVQTSKGMEQTTVVVFGRRAFLLQAATASRQAWDRWAATVARIDASFRARQPQDDKPQDMNRRNQEKSRVLQEHRERRP